LGIGGFQPIPRDPKDNRVVAMQVILTKDGHEKFMNNNMAAMQFSLS